MTVLFHTFIPNVALVFASKLALVTVSFFFRRMTLVVTCTLLEIWMSNETLKIHVIILSVLCNFNKAKRLKHEATLMILAKRVIDWLVQ